MMIRRRWRILSTSLPPRIKLGTQLFRVAVMGNAKDKSTHAKPCPICGALATYETRPFCSKRCADIDLGRWFQGAYAIPAVDAADDSIIDAELATSGKIRDPDPRERHS